jgi:hypothetical protein
MLACIEKGIHAEDAQETGMELEKDVVKRSNLGYCELFHFKCAGARTCDAWLVGGPIK